MPHPPSSLLQVSITIVSLATPLAAFAQQEIGVDELVPGLLEQALIFVDMIMPFLGAIIILAVLWGAFWLFSAAGDQERMENARMIMIYGFVGATVLLLAWEALQFYL
jgi:uncharacterized membrane protein YeaQ/YmgE (transglycosylase-associated protein family)